MKPLTRYVWREALLLAPFLAAVFLGFDALLGNLPKSAWEGVMDYGVFPALVSIGICWWSRRDLAEDLRKKSEAPSDAGRG